MIWFEGKGEKEREKSEEPIYALLHPEPAKQKDFIIWHKKRGLIVSIANYFPFNFAENIRLWLNAEICYENETGYKIWRKVYDGFKMKDMEK